MSIIYDALKKLEKQKSSFIAEGECPGGGGDGFACINKKSGGKMFFRKKNKLPMLILILIIVSLVFVFTKLKNKRPEYFSYTPAEPEVIEFIKKQETNISPTTAHSLEGIVYDGKDSFAIINGMIVKEDDLVGDQVVVEITKNQVKLLNPGDDASITLTLSF